MENRKLIVKNRILVVLLMLYLFLPLWVPAFFGISAILGGDQWLLFSCETKEGKVIDADTNEPIEGAIVIATWGLSSFWKENPLIVLVYMSPLFFLNQPGYPATAKVLIQTTDKNGEYKIPAWKSFQPLQYSYCLEEHNKPYIVIYKPGYDITTIEQNTTKSFHALKMSLAVEDIEKNFQYLYGARYSFSEHDWITATKLIENALANLPEKAKIKIEKDINDHSKTYHRGGK